MQYHVFSKGGLDFGRFEAKSPEEAFRAMIKDAGYKDPCILTGTVEDWDVIDSDDPGFWVGCTCPDKPDES